MSGINVFKIKYCFNQLGFVCRGWHSVHFIINASIACQLMAIMYKYRHVRSYFAGRKYMDPLFMAGVQFQVTLCHIFSIRYLIGERITETLLLLWTRARSSAPSNWLLAQGSPTTAPIIFHALWLSTAKKQNSNCNIGDIIAFLQKRSRVPGWHSPEY